MNRRELFKSAVLGALTGRAQAQSTEAWTPLLFDPHQNETIIVMSELIIPATDTPGAREAKANQYIDLYLHDVDPELGRRVLAGLGWLDGYAQRKHGAPFVKCSEAQQVEILKSLDSGGSSELKTGAALFRDVKQLTITGYYTSKIGIAEMNKGGRVPPTYACRHDDHEG